MRKQELMFAILKQLAIQEIDIIGGRRRRSSLRRLWLSSFARRQIIFRAGRHLCLALARSAASACAPATPSKATSAARKEGERYFALLKVNTLNFETLRSRKHKVNFDNLTPLFPDQRFRLELEDPTRKDLSARVIDIVAPIGKGQRA